MPDHSLVAPRLPARVTIAALLLAGCILLPFAPNDDISLLRLLIEVWREDWLSGMLLTLVIGAPHAFALALVLANRTGGPWSVAAVKAWVTLMQAEVALFGLFVLRAIGRGQQVQASWVIIGFAAITTVRFAGEVARPRPYVAPHDLRFFGRWGAILVVGVFAWGELQNLGRPGPGMWFHATLAAAFLLAACTPRRDR